MKHHGSGPTARIAHPVILSAYVESADEIVYEISYGESGGSFVIFNEKIRDSAGHLLFDREDAEAYPMGQTITYLSSDRNVFVAIRQGQFANVYEEASTVQLVARDVSRISKYRLDPSNLEKPSVSQRLRRRISRRASAPRRSYRATTWLRFSESFSSETQNPGFDVIVEKCRSIIDGFDTFELRGRAR